MFCTNIHRIYYYTHTHSHAHACSFRLNTLKICMHSYMYILSKHVWVVIRMHVCELCACVCVTN